MIYKINFELLLTEILTDIFFEITKEGMDCPRQATTGFLNIVNFPSLARDPLDRARLYYFALHNMAAPSDC